MKKLICILLAAVLCAGLLPCGAEASEPLLDNLKICPIAGGSMSLDGLPTGNKILIFGRVTCEQSKSMLGFAEEVKREYPDMDFSIIFFDVNRSLDEITAFSKGHSDTMFCSESASGEAYNGLMWDIKNEYPENRTFWLPLVACLDESNNILSVFTGNRTKGKILDAYVLRGANPSGQLGGSVSWSYDAKSGCLSFSGKGEMVPENKDKMPWVEYMGEIESVSIPEGITSICENAFLCAFELKSVSIPSSVTSIGSAAFLCCDLLSSVSLHNGISYIGRSAFSGCSELSSIVLPDAIENISPYAFSGCSSLKQVVLSEKTRTIGDAAFSNCWIETITIPKSVTRIALDAFDTFQLTVKGYEGTVAEYWCKTREFASQGTIRFVSIGKAAPGLTNVFCREMYSGEHMFDDIDENAWYGIRQQGCIKSAYELGIMRGKTNAVIDPIDLLPSELGTRLREIIQSEDFAKNPEKYRTEIDEIMRKADAAVADPAFVVPKPPAALFDPLGSLSLAEAVKMEAVLRSYYNADGYEFRQGAPWYQTYVDYAVLKGIIAGSDFSDYGTAATRAQMAYIFAKALPESELSAINTISALPDVQESDKYGTEIFRLYRAGVLTGSDAQGSFKPDSTISRAEAAAIIRRVAKPEQKINIALA